MALRPTRSQARQFAELLSKHEPAIRQAFMRAVVDLQANVDWPALLAALESGSTFSAVQALNINEGAFNEYSQVLTSVFVESGTATASLIVGTGQGAIGLRFNLQNPAAEKWIRQNVATRVVGFVQEQVEVAREVIAAGYAQGHHPHTIALDLAGRVTNGTRQGGIMGLDAPRAARLAKVSEGMRSANGVQDLVVQRLDGSLAMRYKVNKATEHRILSAYAKGEAVPEAQRILSERQYSNALLKARADTVATTETSAAVMGARDNAWEQAAQEQGLDRNAVIKTWRHRRGADGRITHIEMAGVSVQGLDTPFVLSDGSVMLYPHDPAGGAHNVINCGCDVEYKLVRRVS
ncbi:MAG TPA: hypothetical protein VFD09_09310 [Thiopseudomonas sp.]|nr:hypothetical protein [Thiopseudomonas sp.]